MEVHLGMFLRQSLFLDLPLIWTLEVRLVNHLQQLARRVRTRKQFLIGPMRWKSVAAFGDEYNCSIRAY